MSALKFTRAKPRNTAQYRNKLRLVTAPANPAERGELVSISKNYGKRPTGQKIFSN